MSMIFEQFQILRPQFLWLLIPVVLIYFAGQKKVAASSTWEKVCDATLLKYLLISKNDVPGKIRSFIIYTGLFFGVLALSGPSFKSLEQPTILSENPLMIVLNLSTDMNRRDVHPSKLARAKIEIVDILKKTAATPTGLIVYTAEPFLISPLASDSNIIINLLKAVQTDIMPLNGNKTNRAINFAAERLKESGYQKGNILLLTPDVPLHFDLALKAAQNASDNGFNVSVYSLSLQQNDKLTELVKAGDGVLGGVSYTDNSELIRFLENDSASKMNESDLKILVPQDNGIWFAYVAAFCFLLTMRRGFFVFLLCLFLEKQALAGFFFNNNQEGALLFSSKEYSKAAEKFDNEAWKASAYYRAGNYKQAVQILNSKTDVTSLYNKANALAKDGQIPEAIKVYEQVLKAKPDHEDAKFNLEYLKQFLQNQQKDQSSDNKDQENPQDKNQNNQNQQSDENEQNENDNSKPQESDQDEESDKEDNEEQQQQQEMSADTTEKEPDESSNEQNNDENNLENDKQSETKEIPELPAKEGQDEQYDETVQAREQQFRDIQEDPGGLLKAFIKQEYLKHRYENEP